MIDTKTEIAFCNECISHLLENVGPDHIILRYRAALNEIEQQAARIAELEDLLITERDGIFQRQKARIAELEGEYEAVTKCFNCGKRAWEIDANEDADLGAIRFDRGSPGNRDEPPEPAQAYFVCNDCLKAEGKIGSSDHIVGADKKTMHDSWTADNAATAKRITELEEWLIDERSRALFNSSWDSGLPDDCGYDAEIGACRDEARRLLAAEGKIGSSEHIVGADNMIGLTKEQRAIIEAGIKRWEDPNWTDNRDKFQSWEPVRDLITMLRALLASSPPAWEATAERTDALNVAVCELEHIGMEEFQVFARVLRAMLEEVEGK